MLFAFGGAVHAARAVREQPLRADAPRPRGERTEEREPGGERGGVPDARRLRAVLTHYIGRGSFADVLPHPGPLPRLRRP